MGDVFPILVAKKVYILIQTCNSYELSVLRNFNIFYLLLSTLKNSVGFDLPVLPDKYFAELCSSNHQEASVIEGKIRQGCDALSYLQEID